MLKSRCYLDLIVQNLEELLTNFEEISRLLAALKKVTSFKLNLPTKN